MFGLFKVSLNSLVLIEFLNSEKDSCPTNKYPWVNLTFLTPTVKLPRLQQDGWGEWCTEFNIKANTTVSIGAYPDIDFHFNVQLLGFGFAFHYQYGY